MTKTFFKDTRTGTVYVTPEKTLPRTGAVPVKAAYKEDTSWIDRSHLETVKDPHEATTGRAVGQLFILLVVLGLWFFAGVQTSHEQDISLTTALWLQGGWSFVAYVLLLKVSGTVHL